MKYLYCFICVLLVTCCGKDEGSAKHLSGSLAIIIQLPATISKSSGRYDAFLKTVEFMRVTAQVGARKKEYRFTPNRWEILNLNDIPLPKAGSEKLELNVEVWDRLEDGFRRTYPILKGQGAVSSSDLEVGKTHQTRILLHAQATLR